jgi:hypothetical protein
MFAESSKVQYWSKQHACVLRAKFNPTCDRFKNFKETNEEGS